MATKQAYVQKTGAENKWVCLIGIFNANFNEDIWPRKNFRAGWYSILYVSSLEK